MNNNDPVKLSDRVRPDCEVPRWVYEAILKQEAEHDAVRDQALDLTRERDALRAIVHITVAVAGGSCAETVSLDFLKHLPEEVQAIKMERDALRAITEQDKKNLDDLRAELLRVTSERGAAVNEANEAKRSLRSFRDSHVAFLDAIGCENIFCADEPIVARIKALRAEVDQARRTSQMWKDQHLAGNLEIDSLRSEVERLRPYEQAIRSRHNGYDPEACAALAPFLKEPETPKQAIDELIEESEAPLEKELAAAQQLAIDDEKTIQHMRARLAAAELAIQSCRYATCWTDMLRAIAAYDAAKGTNG